MIDFASAYREALCRLLQDLDLERIRTAIGWFAEARDQQRQIFVFGNGGSAATASHFATDLVKGASYGRPQRFRIFCLNDPLPTLTAYANDTGYENVFAEQLENFARPGDLVVAISSSGNSPNVLRAIQRANSLGCRTVGLTGRDGGQLGTLVHLELRAPDSHTGRIEDLHLVICHIIAYYFMEQPPSPAP